MSSIDTASSRQVSIRFPILSRVLTLGVLIAVVRFQVGMLSVLAACSPVGLLRGLL